MSDDKKVGKPVRVAGPGCDPAPRLIPRSDKALILCICAELIDGVVHPVVYVGDEATPMAEKGRLYTAQMMVVADPRDGDNRVRADCGCRAGRMCKAHGPAWAKKWWATSQERDNAREWVACDPDGDGFRGPDGRRVHLPAQPTRKKAEAVARDHGLRHIKLIDGRWDILEVVEVGNE